ncbi:hypothetical protein F4775DRAFT_533468 [Biscogniauxia sp. FL1348]|nr:hypothetical protein F4775DRAFT_533468 [Biscogniauxia sp. FL1348]
MDNDQDISLKRACDNPTPFATSSVIPAINFRRGEYGRADASLSCVICRQTVLLNYFNCCAVCRNVVKPRNSSRRWEHSLSPTAAEIPTSAVTPAGHLAFHDNADKGGHSGHCNMDSCRLRHNRWVLAALALWEIAHLVIMSVLLSTGVAKHDWSLLRLSGVLAVQWWQLFLLPRRCYAGRSIVVGQLAACAFLVWFSVEGRSDWSWWEPVVVGIVLLKIAFPR